MIGRSINNYQIRAEIGQGGMGTVYVAQHPFMGRKAAIKVLRAAYAADQQMVELFMNEARAVNAIRHPNIVDIIDVGHLEDGRPYLMMEFLEGETLGDRLGRIHRLPPPDALDFVQQAAEAMAVAHDRGIVHRDLKPDNLLLVPDLGLLRGERVKVVDFGIAKLQGRADAPSSSGIFVMGSPLYMAPEQCSHDTSEVDHRADIYALGGLLYHALCGVPPFVNDALGGLLAMHLHSAPALPRSIDRDIPAHVEEAILRALAKRPEDRFSSMRTLVAALRAGPVGRHSRTQRHSALTSADDTRLTRLPSRRGRRLGWAGLTLAAGLAALAVVKHQPLRERVMAEARGLSAAVVLRVKRAAAIPAPIQVPPETETATEAAGPMIVPLPVEEEAAAPPPVKRPRPRAHAASAASLGGLGREVLDREDLWGRRH